MSDNTFKKRCLYVAVTVVCLFVVLAALWHVSEILGLCGGIIMKCYGYIAPLLYAFIIAYLLYIPMNKLESVMKKNSRIAAVKPGRLRTVTLLLTYVSAIALVVVIIASIYMMIGGQLSKNVDFKHIVDYIINYFSDFSFGPINIKGNPSATELIKEIQIWLEDYLKDSMPNIGAVVTNIGGKVITGVVSLVISIYFLMDYENLVSRIRKIYMNSVGKKHIGRRIYKCVSIFNSTFKQFLKGQLLEAVLVAVLCIIALRIVGVNYYGVIGVISGICNLIPYLGPWIGAAIAVVVSLLGGGYSTAVWAAVAMIIVQQIDNHLLAPKVVGDSVGLHPVIIMIVLLIGADVSGIFGMLLAVPVAATVKNIIEARHNMDNIADAVAIEDNETAGS